MSTATADNDMFVCDCEERMRSACSHELFFKQSKDKRYCVLHYPGEEKAEQFSIALERKRKAKDFDFTGVWFPDVSFSRQTLNQASFKEATFRSLADFSETKFDDYVDFGQAEFGGSVDFRGADIADGRFQYAKFEIADFTGAKFGVANFLEGEFKQANFVNAQFSGDAFFNPIRVSESTNFRSAEFEGKAYFGKADLSVAYFGEAKFATSVDFGEAQFANSNFEKAQFSDRANFGEARFGSDVVFEKTQFKAGDFKNATFVGTAHFDNAEFTDEANFEETVVTKSALFNKTEFGKKAYFYKTRFIPDDTDNNQEPGSPQPALSESERTVSFDSARFKDTVVFESCVLENVRLHLGSATVEQPGRVTFHSISLRPIWFIRFDSRALQFVKVRWRNLHQRKIISTELQALRPEDVSTAHESLEIVCRQLAVNAEENNRYDEAARFRFIANEARRRETWYNLRKDPDKWESWSNLNPLLWFYGGVSGYGERAWQAAAVLIGILFLFTSLFFFGQRSGQWWRFSQSDIGRLSLTAQTKEAQDRPPLLRDLREAALYSAYVMALQKPEPLPANKRAKILVLIETLVGPLQLALLALAIRRKFMR